MRATAEDVEDVYLYAKHDDVGLAPEHVRRIAG